MTLELEQRRARDAREEEMRSKAWEDMEAQMKQSANEAQKDPNPSFDAKARRCARGPCSHHPS